jgi:DNA-binding transcriptional ArsR family regulator
MAVKHLDTTLAALADPTRRRVVELLRDRPRRAGELAVRTRTSAPAMSRHLRMLRTSGLVEATLSDEDARVRVYQLRPDRLRAIHAWLDSFWAGQLDSFKAHVERKR